jgi:hypothetical protein
MPNINPIRGFSFKKILLAVVLAFVTVGIAAAIVAVIFPQIPAIITVKMKFPKAEYEFIYQTPKNREISSSSKIKGGETISLNGRTFVSPWTSNPEKISKDNIETYLYKKEGKAIFLDESLSETLSEIKPYDNETELNRIKLLYGEEILKSNYLFYEAILNVNPDELNIFTSRSEGLAKSILVIYKSILVVPLDGGMYNFETDNVKGFQNGDPKVSKGVEIQFYDGKDDPYSILLQGANQEEIDFIINSIK